MCPHWSFFSRTGTLNGPPSETFYVRTGGWVCSRPQVGPNSQEDPCFERGKGVDPLDTGVNQVSYPRVSSRECPSALLVRQKGVLRDWTLEHSPVWGVGSGDRSRGPDHVRRVRKDEKLGFPPVGLLSGPTPTDTSLLQCGPPPDPPVRVLPVEVFFCPWKGASTTGTATWYSYNYSEGGLRDLFCLVELANVYDEALRLPPQLRREGYFLFYKFVTTAITSGLTSRHTRRRTRG